MDVRTVGAASKASLVQRTGRTGRTQAGKCYRLFSEDLVHPDPLSADMRGTSDTATAAGRTRQARAPTHLMLSHNIPEIQRCDLAATVLGLKALGIDDVLHFDFLSPPSTHGLSAALELLYGLGAVSGDGLLTNTGVRMSEFPVHPR